MSDNKINLEQSRKDILLYIQRHFTMSDLTRAKDLKNKRFTGFGSYKAFLAFQEQCLYQATPEEINDLQGLINFIKKYGPMNMDKEDMCAFETNGFCFESSGKLVMFNER